MTSSSSSAPIVDRACPSARCLVRAAWVVLFVGSAQPVMAQSAPSPRFATECAQRLPRGSVDVVERPGELRYDLDTPLRKLTARARSTGSAFTLGLTEARISHRLQWRGPMLVDPATRLSCVRPQVHLELSVYPMTVSVAREFEPGSCAFEAILAHEQRHVRVNEQALRRAALAIRAHAGAHFGERIFYGDRDTLRRQFEDVARTHWVPMVRQELDRAETDHRHIDSPQEYARYRTICDGAIAQVIDALHGQR